MPTDDLTLWGIGTPRTFRAHWVLCEFGLDYTCRPVRSRSGETTTAEFLAINPKHKVPVLQHGGLVLTESAAIATYVSEAFPAPAGFFVPRDARRRARLNELCFFIMTELDALSLYVIRRHADLFALYGEAPRAVESAKANFVDLAGAVFSDFDGENAFLMPEGMSIADQLLTTCLDSALRRDIVIPAPLVPYHARMRARPAYREAMARNNP